MKTTPATTIRRNAGVIVYASGDTRHDFRAEASAWVVLRKNTIVSYAARRSYRWSLHGRILPRIWRGRDDLRDPHARDALAEPLPMRSFPCRPGVLLHRHGLSNAREVVRLLSERHALTLVLAGHIHSGEKLEYEVDGVNVRYHQAAAVSGPGGSPGMTMLSGVTLYRVEDGKIDDGEFIPLDRSK